MARVHQLPDNEFGHRSSVRHITFPLLADRLHQLASRGRTIRIWCCAASTGEEPYSIAMTSLETLGAGARIVIDASDIDTNVLAAAARGSVRFRRRQGSWGAARARRFFQKGTAQNEGKVRIKPEVRSMVRFFQLNLLGDHWALEPYDVVFCRNVMIYFDKANPTSGA